MSLNIQLQVWTLGLIYQGVSGGEIVSLDILRTVSEKWEFPEFPEFPEFLRAVSGKIIVSLDTLRTGSEK